MEILLESYGGGWERGEGSVTGERKAEVQGSQGTEPVRSGQGTGGAQETVFQPPPGTAPLE